MTTPPAPARLFVLLAREAPAGVILRRGPSDWVQMIHWDTKNDVFTPGQWFHGRVYEYKCDLNPNGKFIVYHAYKRGNRGAHPDYGNAWTAISRPPYFTALALWPHYNGYGGGSYFPKHNVMLLNHLDENRVPHPKHQPPKGWNILEADEYAHMPFSIYSMIQLRDGWRPVGEAGKSPHFSAGFGKRIERRGRDVWIHGLLFGKSRKFPTLAKTQSGMKLICDFMGYSEQETRGRYRFHLYNPVPIYWYRMISEKNGLEYELEDAIWADIDGRGRIVLAKDGKLLTAAITDQGELSLIELADFNTNKPERVKTPAWAKKW